MYSKQTILCFYMIPNKMMCNVDMLSVEMLNKILRYAFGTTTVTHNYKRSAHFFIHNN